MNILIYSEINDGCRGTDFLRSGELRYSVEPVTLTEMFYHPIFK